MTLNELQAAIDELARQLKATTDVAIQRVLLGDMQRLAKQRAQLMDGQ